MLRVFLIIVLCNVLFVVWRVWVSRVHPRNPEPAQTEGVPAAAYLENAKRTTGS
ncbi:MAG: hypothetical protein ACRYHA_10700 [Janthinobacterium lividum]